MRPAWLVLLGGCTLGPGTGFSTLEHLTLTTQGPEAELETDLGYVVAFDAIELRVGALSLEALSGGAATFDPANPPPGYSLCHNGHCHADDGTLPTYAEIEALLAGDSATWEPVAWVTPEPLDLLDPAGQDPAIRPSPLLPLGEIGRVSLALQRLVLEARVTPPEGEPAPWSIDLPLDATLTGSLFLVVDRDAPPELSIDVTLPVPEGWLDDLLLEPGAEGLADAVASRVATWPLDPELR